ncbi:MAG: hypothetical protein ABIS68_04850 [Casimicrobiaceae bacterium]
MNCNTAQIALPVSASTPVGAAWDSIAAKLAALHQAHVARSAQARATATFSDIDQHTLRDIGAPNWLIAEASLRHDSRALRLIDLYRS